MYFKHNESPEQGQDQCQQVLPVSYQVEQAQWFKKIMKQLWPGQPFMPKFWVEM
jgi:hypothetical protein